MLFRKNMEPRCGYCQNSVMLDSETVMCTRKGVMPSEGHCRGFRYDPLKRVPPRPAAPDFSKLRDEDFTL
ncbi:MAG: hypothetical protein H6Q60_1291 [Oscillospiraceae bacterium]|nr:hypothetical protein [Oscillospiraceae bacterium]